MSDSNFRRPYPQYLSSPLQILWLEADSFCLWVMSLTVALIFGGWSWLLVIVVPFLYGGIKKNQPRGFLRHMLYYTGFVEMKNYPNYFEREFLE